jgi:hypothetical protein
MTKKITKQKPQKKEDPFKFKIKDWQVIIFFGIITLLFFWDILTQKKFFWEDFVYQYYPFRNFAAVAFSNGIIPFWNPYTFGGMPFIADIQTAFFYPLHLLLTLFVSNNSLDFVFLEYLIIFHYFLAGIFSYYLAKSLQLDIYASILTAITFMFCGFMVTHLIHETMIIQFTYMPLIFLFYNKSFETGKWRNTLLTGLFMGIAILCGHPQITLYMFFTLALFAIYKFFFVIKENGFKFQKKVFEFIGLAAAPFILGIMLGAIQLLPTFTISGLSERAVMTYNSTLEGSLGYHQFFTLIAPKFFGSTNAAHTDIPYWGNKGFWLYWESCIYVGLAALVFGSLALFVLRKNKNVIFFFIISVLSLLYVLGDNFIIYKLFYYLIPGFNKFRGVGRFGMVFSFGISLLAGYGFDYLIKNPVNEKIKKFLKYFLFFIGALIVLWILYIAKVFTGLANTYSDPLFYKNSIHQLSISIITLLIILGLIYAYIRELILPGISLFLIILISFFDLYLFGANHNNSPRNPNMYYAHRKLAGEIREANKNELFRINSRSIGGYMFFERNQGMIDNIFLMEGYNPLNLQKKFPPGKTYDLMNVKYYTSIDIKTATMSMYENENYMPRLWMSYKPIVESSDENTIKILLDSTFNYREIVTVDKSPEIVTDTVPAKNKLSITGYELNKIQISAESEKNGILVLSEVSYPAWKVYVDGVEKPILRCDYSLRGVAIEKGNHKVVFEYVDEDYKRGMVLSLSGLGIIIIGFVYSFIRKKNKAAI